MNKPRTLYKRLGDVAAHHGWNLDDWKERGCAIHLEVSELIEAFRGKGDESVLEEGADVLICLLAMMKSRNVSIAELWTQMQDKINKLEAEPSRCENRVWRPPWRPPCDYMTQRDCSNAVHPVVCGSCVPQIDGYTNFKPRERVDG